MYIYICICVYIYIPGMRHICRLMYDYVRLHIYIYICMYKYVYAVHQLLVRYMFFLNFVTGNFRILKWRYCAIYKAICFGDIPLHRPHIGLIVIVWTELTWGFMRSFNSWTLHQDWTKYTKIQHQT